MGFSEMVVPASYMHQFFVLFLKVVHSPPPPPPEMAKFPPGGGFQINLVPFFLTSNEGHRNMLKSGAEMGEKGISPYHNFKRVLFL